MTMLTAFPRVSIGLPVFNGERFLEETLNSLLEQTFTDLELIISDNASTDQTERICRAYAAKDRRIRYYRNEKNLGAAQNYNRVFALATGEYFKWAAADDLCAPDFLKRCVEILDREPQVAVSHSRTKIIDAHGRVINYDESRLHLQAPSPSKRFLQLMRSLRKCNTVFGLIRSSILKRTRLIGNFIASDSCLLAELALYGKFYEIPEYLFFRRDHAGASSRNRGRDQQLEFFDPQLKGKLVLPKWRRIFENSASVYRAPIKLREKMFLWTYLGYSIVLGRNGYGTELRNVLKEMRQYHSF
jgi:glycosyltransferase involved in cell wall biosynthesis